MIKITEWFQGEKIVKTGILFPWIAKYLRLTTRTTEDHLKTF